MQLVYNLLMQWRHYKNKSTFFASQKTELSRARPPRRPGRLRGLLRTLPIPCADQNAGRGLVNNLFTL